MQSVPLQKQPNMTRGRALLIKLLQIYSSQGYEHTKLEVQKLMYFLQESGINLRLKYEPNNYGPYAENLNHVLTAIDGHYIMGFGDRVSKSEIKLVSNAVNIADSFLEGDKEAQRHLEKVKQLIEGYETPLSLEILSTVHWAAKHHKLDTLNIDSVKNAIHDWSDRKKRIKDKYIEKAYRKLLQQGWITQPSISSAQFRPTPAGGR